MEKNAFFTYFLVALSINGVNKLPLDDKSLKEYVPLLKDTLDEYRALNNDSRLNVFFDEEKDDSYFLFKEQIMEAVINSDYIGNTIDPDKEENYITGFIAYEGSENNYSEYAHFSVSEEIQNQMLRLDQKNDFYINDITESFLEKTSLKQDKNITYKKAIT